MTPLSSEQKQLIFDHSLGLTTAEQTAEVEKLVSEHPEAAKLKATLQSALSPLDTVEIEPCPDELVQGTLWRIKQTAAAGLAAATADQQNTETDRAAVAAGQQNTETDLAGVGVGQGSAEAGLAGVGVGRGSDERGHEELEQLLAGEQARSAGVGISFWQEMGKRLATAAVFVIVGSLLITTFKVISGYARQNAQVQLCGMNMNNIFQGLSNYKNDHGGKMPAMAASANAPWWKLGYQGDTNESNGRVLWYMVKMNYIEPSKFLCPGWKRVAVIDSCDVKDFQDFPSRDHIGYSFRIECEMGTDGKLHCRSILLADLTPVFEELPDYSERLNIRLDERLLKANSRNHDRNGQNVLRGDGAVNFHKSRFVGIGQDDIYTLQTADLYEGFERPTLPNDSFVAP